MLSLVDALSSEGGIPADIYEVTGAQICSCVYFPFIYYLQSGSVDELRHNSLHSAKLHDYFQHNWKSGDMPTLGADNKGGRCAL